MKNPLKIWYPAVFGFVLGLAVAGMIGPVGIARATRGQDRPAKGQAAARAAARARRAQRAAALKAGQNRPGQNRSGQVKAGANKQESSEEEGHGFRKGTGETQRAETAKTGASKEEPESGAQVPQTSERETNPDGSRPMRRRPLGPIRQAMRNAVAGGGQLGAGGARAGQGPAGINPQRLRQQVLKQIGVTPEQQAQMLAIHDKHDDEVVALGRRIRQSRRALNQAIMADHFDQGEVDRAAEELGNAQKDQVLLNARIRSEQRQVLTPEQVTRMKALEQQIQQGQQQQRRFDLQNQDSDAPPSKPPGSDEIGEDNDPDPLDLIFDPKPMFFLAYMDSFDPETPRR